jgi:hypothetical protein
MPESATQNPDTTSKNNNRFNHYPLFAPRVWHGMQVRDWFRLLAQNKYRIERWPMAGFVTCFSGFNSTAAKLQEMTYGRQIAKLPLASDPIFIVGHWRTGTTLLHELFSLDKRYHTPTTFQCFAPRHFLLTEPFVTRIMSLPGRRPMDNMAMGWTTPQEDEFALCSMGLPTTYRSIAFPNHPPRHLDYLNMEGIPAEELKNWKAGLMEFVKTLNFAARTPLVLKSPPHTGRIRVLLEMFPNAKFIHIARNPYEFIPSTIHLWNALEHSNGLQIPREDHSSSDYVFDCFDRLYDGYNSQKHRIDSSNLFEVQYEELIRDPIPTCRRIYKHLGLQDFEVVSNQYRKALEKKRDYKRNRHAISDSLRERIAAHCSEYIEKFGYTGKVAAA